VSDALYGDAELAPMLRALPAVTPLTRDVFDGATAERRLAGYFAVASTQAFGALSRLELTAAAACITYVERTPLGKPPPPSPPRRNPPAAPPSAPRGAGLTARHRPGDAYESRTGAHACGGAARLAACRN